MLGTTASDAEHQPQCILNQISVCVLQLSITSDSWGTLKLFLTGSYSKVLGTTASDAEHQPQCILN